MMVSGRVFARCSFCEDRFLVPPEDVAANSNQGAWLCSVCRRIPAETRANIVEDSRSRTRTVRVTLEVDGRDALNIGLEWNPAEEPLVDLVERMAVSLALTSEEQADQP